MSDEMSEEVPGDPRRHQEATGGAKRPQEATGGDRRPQAAKSDTPMSENLLLVEARWPVSPRNDECFTFLATVTLQGVKICFSSRRGGRFLGETTP